MTAITTSAARDVARSGALLREFVLLAAADGPRHGYELARQLGDGRPANMGQLYRLLRQLEAVGLMHSDWEHSLAGPSRRIYSLTPAGEDAVGECRVRLERLESGLGRYTARYEAFRGHRHRLASTVNGVGGSLPERRAEPPASAGDDGPSGGVDSREVVQCYLDALEARRALPSAKQLRANLVLLDELLTGADPQTRLRLVQRRQELQDAAAIGSGEGLARAEAAFIAVARAYSESESITYAAWQELGLEARVLQAAGLAPSDEWSAPTTARCDTPCPTPLLRALLLLLVGETPRHGYELCEALIADDIGHVDASRVYRVLRGLDDDTLVASQWQASLQPAPDRRVYSLTAAGVETLDGCAEGIVELRLALRRRTGGGHSQARGVAGSALALTGLGFDTAGPARSA